ncbi:TetR/AcrR family transcriptional regulator [Blastococcus tunisiensis]|uniref:DNA-binding transcriptional regulator, AcrR family n=1 Tax=Blastococcus tunisiensis TaxID=1798228 RepID=A0A1I2EE96_9ACTN|nr:TetR/AcrR family transcriptional regulator [Blastococcus sp. DSM 46838]SFE91039.1 DNA-binding transcriptional regulator, AcrR family [Blastococcus sp. DSM 46838]
MTRSDAAENVSRLLRAARDAVAAEGTGVGVRSIADRAGVGVSTLYRHFPDKGTLIDAVSVHRWVTMHGLARCPATDDAVLSRIVLLVDTFSRMVTADDAFIESAGIRVGRLPDVAIKGPKAAFDRTFVDLWVRAQRQGQVHQTADPRDLVELTGAIRDRRRRPSQLRLLVQGVCVRPDDGTELLARHLAARDPRYL